MSAPKEVGSNLPPAPAPVAALTVAPTWTTTKVIAVATLALAAIALIVLYVLGKGALPYVIAPYAVAGLSVATLIYQSCVGKKNVVYVKVGDRTVCLSNIRRVEHGVFVVPGDGNCLFHSCLASLKAMGKKDVPNDHLALRKATVQWMRDNVDKDGLLRGNLLAGMADHFRVEKRKLSDEKEHPEIELDRKQTLQAQITDLEGKLEKIDEATRNFNSDILLQHGELRPLLNTYFQQMEQERTHGTSAEIYALSEMCQVGINAYGDAHKANGHIHLLNQANHYNFRMPTK